MMDVTVSTVPDLLTALAAKSCQVRVSGVLHRVPGLQLLPGQALIGGAGGADALNFAADTDGIAVTANNSVSQLTLKTDPTARCLYLASRRTDANRGTIALADLQATGQLQFLFDDSTQAARLEIARVHVTAADTRHRRLRPVGNGVQCLQGAVTVWNRAQQENELEVAIDTLSIGSAGTRRVMGSGLMVSGLGSSGGGRVRLKPASLGAIHIDSGLRRGSRATICGGVFILFGVDVERIDCAGSQVSHGPNAVPIDNWGSVQTWCVEGDITTHGPNAVAVVNAGVLRKLDIRGRIDTYGDGARGCAIYGPTGECHVRAICTRGKAATGVQICDVLEYLSVERGIEIRGKAGTAMVKGQLVNMNADGIHLEAGGRLSQSKIAYISLADSAGLAVRDEALAIV
jgi:hypothetical protein